MYYSTLAARSLIKISRGIGQGCLIFIVLIGFTLFQAPTFIIALTSVITLFIIKKQHALQLAFKQFNQHICRNYVLILYHHLAFSWLFWGVLDFSKAFVFHRVTAFPYQLPILLEALLIFSFFTLIALTLLKAFLCFIDRKKHDPSL